MSMCASYWVNYQRDDLTSLIAECHDSLADDRFAGGVGSEKCLKLAKLNSEALDYAKLECNPIQRCGNTFDVNLVLYYIKNRKKLENKLFLI